MKKTFIRIDYLEKISNHITERSAAKLINDLKPGGYFFDFFKFICEGTNQDHEIREDELSKFRNFFYDSPLYDESLINTYLSRHTSLDSNLYEISEKQVNEIIENAFLSESPDEFLIDFFLEKIYFLFWNLTAFDTKVRIAHNRIDTWRKSDSFRDTIVPQNTEEASSLSDFDILSNHEFNKSEIKDSIDIQAVLKIKNENLKQEFRQIVHNFLKSIQHQENGKIDSIDEFLEVLMLEQNKKKLEFFPDVNVIVKLLAIISVVYEKHSIQSIIYQNEFLFLRRNTTLTKKSYSKNKSRSVKTRKFQNEFNNLELKIRSLTQNIPNF